MIWFSGFYGQEERTVTCQGRMCLGGVAFCCLGLIVISSCWFVAAFILTSYLAFTATSIAFLPITNIQLTLSAPQLQTPLSRIYCTTI